MICVLKPSICSIERSANLILDPSELARTLTRDLGESQAFKYAEKIGRNSTPIGDAYREAAQLIEGTARCEECGVYPAGLHAGICEGCLAYREHTEVF